MAELLKPIRYGQPTDWAGVQLYGGLSVAFAVAVVAYLACLRSPADGVTERHRHDS